jgi:hypothetical protein
MILGIKEIEKTLMGTASRSSRVLQLEKRPEADARTRLRTQHGPHKERRAAFRRGLARRLPDAKNVVQKMRRTGYYRRHPLLLPDLRLLRKIRQRSFSICSTRQEILRISVSNLFDLKKRGALVSRAKKMEGI